MPALFVGHGSPMNAVEDNEFSRRWQEVGQTLPRPQAVLYVLAVKQAGEKIDYFNDRFLAGSISMASFVCG